MAGRTKTTGAFNTREELEAEVLKLQSKGISKKKIGVQVGVSQATVTLIVEPLTSTGGNLKEMLNKLWVMRKTDDA